MNVSESWLRDWVNPDISTAELVEQLTMAGLEVDAVEPVAGEFSGVIVGEIKEVSQHPNADKLRVCQVAGLGDGLTQVVCGAPNARAGLKAPFACVGAKLPGNFKIKKAKLRDVESFGMLCGQTELEAGDDDSGLWELPSDAPVGQDLRTYLKLEDKVIEVDLTPNRSDCLSVQGIARELAVLNRMNISPIKYETKGAEIADSFDVRLSASDACPKYLGRVIKGIDLSKSSPYWLKQKLERSGIRSIDAVVDITNYVLLELGQPMHAFDLEKLDGCIDVRMAKEGEALILLDSQEVELKPDTLVIADNNGALALAGIMGGEASAVSENTTSVFLEAAFFQPVSIAGKARNYGLHTDSSHRFERGVDYLGTEQAMERATQLLLDICGGQASTIISVIDDKKMPAERSVVLKRMSIVAGLGFAIADAEVLDILTRLGLTLASKDSDSWTFNVPSYRFDIAIEADLLEELARIYGYNNLPSRTLNIPAVLPEVSESQLVQKQIFAQLVARDYREVITYSFVDPALHKIFSDEKAVELINPISADMSIMRTSLVPSLVQTLIHNVNRQQDRVRLFERGLHFIPGGNGCASEVEQKSALAGLVYGSRLSGSWNSHNKDAVDFFDIKGDLESILGLRSLTGLDAVKFIPEKNIPYLHPGQAARIESKGKNIGYIGALHPSILKSLDISKPVFVFELNWNELLECEIPVFESVSRFPAVARDLAVVVDHKINASNLLDSVNLAGGEYLKESNIFDVYQGEGIENNKKSIAVSLIFQNASRTLKEDEINISVENVVQRLKDDFNAILR